MFEVVLGKISPTKLERLLGGGGVYSYIRVIPDEIFWISTLIT